MYTNPDMTKQYKMEIRTLQKKIMFSKRDKKTITEKSFLIRGRIEEREIGRAIRNPDVDRILTN